MTQSSDLLALHRKLVSIPSVSHEEGEIADFIAHHLDANGASVRRIGQNVVARKGTGPALLLNSHFDTVPPSDRWTRGPFTPQTEDGRIYGLGSNDALASVACLIRAFLEASANEGELVLMLVPEEETGGQGTELAWPTLQEEGLAPSGVVVGEPTGLDIAASQKGLCIVRLDAEGDACHSANAHDLAARNPIRMLAQDISALTNVDFGAPHPDLGATSCEPTVITGGQARNMVPGAAACTLDLRTVPGLSHKEIVSRLHEVVQSNITLISDRLEPVTCPEDALILQAAREASPTSRVFGSKTMSDMVWFKHTPTIKCGPGQTARSHTPDEYILESELLAGLTFYNNLIRTFFNHCPE